MDLAPLEEAITPRTRAIVAVDVFGRPLDMPRVCRIARRHGLSVIEDSCEALGAKLDGRHAGTFGDVGTFAFYPNKQITTGEGGVLITSDDRLADLCRSMCNQGRGTAGTWLAHERLGYNYRMTELQAAVGAVQMGRLDEILAKRNAVADMYANRLAGEERLILPNPPAEEENSWFVYVVRLADRFGRGDRDAVIARLHAAGIGCRDYFAPIHLQPFYVERFGFRHGSFPNTEHAGDRCLAIPFFNSLSADQIDRVATELSTALDAVGQ
jgi:perosamine synthetase